MSLTLVTHPRYRLNCERQGCSVFYVSQDATVAGDPELLRIKAHGYGWGTHLGEDLCPRHAPPGEYADPIKVLAPEHEWRTYGFIGIYGCRWPRCTHSAVAELRRKYRDGYRWWAYCAMHARGRWVEDGRVYMWADRAQPVVTE